MHIGEAVARACKVMSGNYEGGPRLIVLDGHGAVHEPAAAFGTGNPLDVGHWRTNRGFTRAEGSNLFAAQGAPCGVAVAQGVDELLHVGYFAQRGWAAEAGEQACMQRMSRFGWSR